MASDLLQQTLLRARDLAKRQSGEGGPYGSGPDFDGDGEDDRDYGWWWSPTGLAVRYTIVLVLFSLILLYFVGGYYHARRRIAKGLPPLRYHRWMVRGRLYHQQQQQQQWLRPGPRPENAYDMPSYAYPPPPPAYNHNEAPPPVYQPPEGASKALADQNFRSSGHTHRETGQGAGESSAAGGVSR